MQTKDLFKALFAIGVFLIFASFFLEWYYFEVCDSSGEVMASWSYNPFFGWRSAYGNDYGLNEELRPQDLEMSIIFVVILFFTANIGLFGVLFKDLEKQEDLEKLKFFAIVNFFLISLVLYFVVYFPVYYLFSKNLYFPFLLYEEYSSELTYYHMVGPGYLLMVISFVFITPYSMFFYRILSKFQSKESLSDLIVESKINEIDSSVNFNRLLAEENIRSNSRLQEEYYKIMKNKKKIHLETDDLLKILAEFYIRNEDYKKLFNVCFTLIGNEVDKIGIKLGIRPRDKSKREWLYRHMSDINEFLLSNLKIELFDLELIEEIKKIEFSILSSKITFSPASCKILIEIYYSLRKISMPNLCKSLEEIELPHASNSKFFSGLIGKRDNDLDVTTKIKSLILQKINDNQMNLQREMKEAGYSEHLIEKSLRLMDAERIVKRKKGEKVKVKGKLKDNLLYQVKLRSLFKYFILSVFAIFLIVALTTTYETMVYPYALNALNILILLFYGASAALIFMYYNLYERGE